MPRCYCRHQKYEAEKAGARLPRKIGRKGDIKTTDTHTLCYVLCVCILPIITHVSYEWLSTCIHTIARSWGRRRLPPPGVGRMGASGLRRREMATGSVARGLTWFNGKQDGGHFCIGIISLALSSCTIVGTRVFNTLLSISKKRAMHRHPHAGRQ